jgi:general stress protein YciG
MPTGPNGEKRPADPIANAVRIGQIATGQAKEEYVNAGQSAGGRRGGAARAAAMTPERRNEIAQQGARARWGNGACDTVEEGPPDSPTARH